MINTTAFGAGNDYPHVRVVIHAGSPKEMMGYTQEKSRSGCDKMPALSYVLPRKLGATTTQLVLPPGAIDHKGILIMFDWLYGRLNSVYCRYVITSFIDGVSTKCKDEVNAQPCSICRPSPSSSTMAVLPLPPNPVASSSQKRDVASNAPGFQPP
jgi:superfamily II DNA helicase RecQ